MKRNITLLLAAISFSSYAQTTIVKPDAAIKQMVNDVSDKNIETIVRKLVSFKTRNTLSDTTSKTEGIGAARNWIKSEYERYAKESGGRMTVQFDQFEQPAGGRFDKPTILKNILAILKGTDPADTRIYIVSGHYDSRVNDVMDANSVEPGAVDDASGTAVSMELARIMSKHSFPATIIFMAVAGEEQGLNGSTHVAKRAKEEHWNVDAMLNNDIVGNTHGMDNDLKDNTHVRVFSDGVPSIDLPLRANGKPLFPVNFKGQAVSVAEPLAKADSDAIRRAITAVNGLIGNGGENDSPSRQLARYTKEIGERYVDFLDVKMVYRRDRFLRGGDHVPFLEQGFTAVRFTEMNEDFTRQHQNVRKENGIDYGDMPDFADYQYIQKVGRMNLSVLANLALAPAQPQNVVVLTAALTNKTSLKWDMPNGKKPVGYYILMRETINPYWEKKFYVTDTQAILEYSKDNYFFAVQSVDADGHESLPVFPKPGR